MVEAELDVLRTVIALTVLVLVGRILGTVFSRFRMPEVIGEVSAGIVLGPLALGGIIILFDKPLVELNDLMLAFAQIGAIIILFSAGLEYTFRDLRKAGLPASIVGTAGVVLPMFGGYYVSILFGYEWTVAMLIGATLTATSIAITVRILQELNRQKSVEGNVLVNAALIDDVLGLTVLSLATSIVVAGTLPSITELALVTGQSLAIWFALLLASVLFLPRLVHGITMLRAKGTIEVVSTTSAFGVAAAAGSLGLSPIVGAFAAGMGLAGSRPVQEIREFMRQLKILFGPLFFAIIGTYFDPRQLLQLDITFFVVLLAVAILTKILGCGLPATFLLKSRDKGFKVGYGMVSRGEVGFIIAGIGLASGIFAQGVYSALVLVIMVTTIISPILLRHAYSKSKEE
ncbi:MAG: cation:proton antiporter [Nitrososphaerales archaeon]